MTTERRKPILGAESVQQFTLSLAGLPETEMAKAKELYLRNAISEYKTEKEAEKNFMLGALVQWLIPLFWPQLISQRRNAQKEAEESRQRIVNALNVWKEELGNKHRELMSLLENS